MLGIAESIQQQNWFVVVLEILVVVIGILIGLQVDDWKNKRIALQLEADYLEQLARETDHNLIVYQEDAEHSRTAEALSLAYYQYLNGQAAERPAEAILLGMFCHPGFVSSPSYDNSVLEEMMSSGMLARLQDKTLRNALANNRAKQKVWDQL